MTTVQVRIPTPLRTLTGGKDEIAVTGTTVAEVLDNLDKAHPGIKDRICDEKGSVRRFINVFANDEDIRFLDNLKTALKDGDSISIVPAIAGGR
ncbi:MAG: MoaD/ThiS family protein [Deltaproteobacteria bacterium]|nr:MoaD/ThiS family protein [Deltaproteobacteria bacterium]